jgi:hypothetical protein
MHSRTGTWALGWLLLFGCAGCGDDDEKPALQTKDEDGGVSGRGGTGGSGGGGSGGGGSGGQGAQGGSGGAPSGGRGGGGGHAGNAGAADGGRGGSGGRGGTDETEPACSITRSSLEEWCSDARAHCDLSFDDQLGRLCDEGISCQSNCPHLGVGTNSCGGSSVVAIYGSDVFYITWHYDGQARIVGAELTEGNRCIIDGQLAPVRHLYGAECKRTDGHAATCPAPAADGGI